MHKTLRLAAAGLGLAAVLAACSSSGSSPSAAAPSVAAPSVEPSVAAPSEAASAEASAAASAEASAAAGGGLALTTGALGSFVVAPDGKTLYLFTPDEGGKPTCYDDCAATWPPLTAADLPAAGTGLDASKLTLVDRTDGTKQVAYNNWPLYFFAADKAAGDTGGQGLGGKVVRDRRRRRSDQGRRLLIDPLTRASAWLGTLPRATRSFMSGVVRLWP